MRGVYNYETNTHLFHSCRGFLLDSLTIVNGYGQNLLYLESFPLVTALNLSDIISIFIISASA